MKINWKQPKYMMPLLALPFLCLFFYVYHSGTAKDKKEVRNTDGMNSAVGDVSASIQKKKLTDKLDAYRSTYKVSDGNTAVIPIPADHSLNAAFNNKYSDRQKQQLDSIRDEMRKKYGAASYAASNSHRPVNPFLNRQDRSPAVSQQDQALAKALAGLSNRQKESQAYHSPAIRERDPMETFKKQMAYMDSVGKANDPALKAEKQKQEVLKNIDDLKAKENEKTLIVTKGTITSPDFNTVMPAHTAAFIMAIIDENVTGYAGSRIRLRLLEDVKAGSVTIPKGSYLYALVNGFSGQRVTLIIKSIMLGNKLLPVKLDVYDMDGLLGLYVPQSAFRDFTKDFGTNSIQGVNMDGNSRNGSQFLMSAADKLFQSTSTAIAGAIRKNKAKIKYNSYLYLIDPQTQDKTSNPK